MIIDCNMNLPLLYWATEQTGDPRFADAAKAHVMAATYLIREDASTFHTYYMDVVTGAPRYGNTQQGYADDSAGHAGRRGEFTVFC
jgi:unsaturated chondroitin disaccharide hydrolase